MLIFTVQKKRELYKITTADNGHTVTFHFTQFGFAVKTPHIRKTSLEAAKDRKRENLFKLKFYRGNTESQKRASIIA